MQALPLELPVLLGLLTQFFFAMLRVGAFLLASPVFGGRFVSLPVRIMASVVLTLPVAGKVDLPPLEVLASLQALPLIAGEMVIGLVAGLVLTVMFSAAALAGDRIASTAGLGFAAQFDPAAGGQTPVVSQIFGLSLLMVFLALDGHLTALRILLDSYQTLPPGTALAPGLMVAAGIEAGARMFALGLQITMPVVGALLLINITIGIVTRSAPQLNVFSFGFPVTMSATIILLFLTVPGTTGAFEGVVEEGLQMMRAVLENGDG